MTEFVCEEDVNHNRVKRLWRHEGLRVPGQPAEAPSAVARGRVDLAATGRAPEPHLSLRLRLRPHGRRAEAADAHAGRRVHAGMCRDRGHRRLSSQKVLADLCVRRGLSAYVRSCNGPKFVARPVRRWLARIGVQTLFVVPGSPWENGYIESFNGRLRDEYLNRERFDTLLEVQVLAEMWRNEYNHVRRSLRSATGRRRPKCARANPLNAQALTLQVV